MGNSYKSSRHPVCSRCGNSCDKIMHTPHTHTHHTFWTHLDFLSLSHKYTQTLLHPCVCAYMLVLHICDLCLELFCSTAEHLQRIYKSFYACKEAFKSEVDLSQEVEIWQAGCNKYYACKAAKRQLLILHDWWLRSLPPTIQHCRWSDYITIRFLISARTQ